MPSHRSFFYNVVAPVLSLFGSLNATGQPAVISLPPSTASVGESVITPIAFQSQQGDISCVQFDIEWDISAMNLMAAAGNSSRNAEKRIYQFDISPGKKRFLIFGLNRTSIQSGALADLFSNLRDEISATTHSLKMTNVIATNQQGELVDVFGFDGAITIRENSPSGPKLKSDGVRNGGSLLSGPVAPGEVITVFGSGIGPVTEQFPSTTITSLSLGPTTLLFDGISAPLLYAASDQINAVVPFSISGKTSTLIQVFRDGQLIAGTFVPVAPTAPSIFTQGADGLGATTILNENMTIGTVDNPSERGKTITFFATGVGQLDPPGQDGEIVSDDRQHPLLPLSVKIGGIDTDVLSTGSAPFSVTGVVQVSCRVPVDVAPGPSVAIVLSVGEEKSQAGATISLQ